MTGHFALRQSDTLVTPLNFLLYVAQFFSYDFGSNMFEQTREKYGLAEQRNTVWQSGEIQIIARRQPVRASG